MGRTIPSFRMASVEEQKEWREFRQALDKKDRKVFDDMFSICRLYNSVCSFAATNLYVYNLSSLQEANGDKRTVREKGA
jgi:hypothetical protein